MQCKYCKQHKPEIDFEIAVRKGDRIWRRLKCKTCKHRTATIRRQMIAEWIANYKKTKVCENCGYKDYRCLQFHHTKDKKRDISCMTSWSIKAIKQEIKKCKILCANCHVIETANNRIIK